MTYRWRFAAPAETRFQHLTHREQQHVIARIEQLCSDPQSPGLSKALKGRLAGVRSSRIGARRILFAIDGDLLIILDIGPRGDVYKRS